MNAGSAILIIGALLLYVGYKFDAILTIVIIVFALITSYYRHDDNEMRKLTKEKLRKQTEYYKKMLELKE